MYASTVSQLVGFIREQYGDTFKAYYDGDPDLIPTFNLPAIIVSKNSDRTENGPTGMQRVTEELVVKVVYDKMDDWTANIETTDLTEKKIRDLVEQRDPQTGMYLESTLKHAVLNKFTITGAAIDQGMTFDLGVNPRDLTEGSELITQEGHLTLTLTYLVPNALST